MRLSRRQAALSAVSPGVAVTAVRSTVHRNHARNPAVWRQERGIGRQSVKVGPPLTLLRIPIG
ncbi:unnamed protein product [Tetraodon nigroviridis]|uniref:(spotted green pufferfish) hypothetical protein n=1 Tax=Tetraodon nigroviridis TaxID=99883 RepID=Q4RVN8_TETNG|nr:unnamed protein product [Tetraodon nigroviridis]